MRYLRSDGKILDDKDIRTIYVDHADDTHSQVTEDGFRQFILLQIDTHELMPLPD